MTAGTHRVTGEPPGVRQLRWLLLLALGTTVLGVAVPLAPVQVDDPTVSWPRAGEEARSTDLPLAPYRPLAIDATVPCSALRPDVVAVRTLPGDAVDQGLTVASSGGRVGIRVSGRLLLDEPTPPGACEYRISVDEDGARIGRDGATLATEQVLAPQVAQLVTDAADRRGLRVVLHPDDRYASSPTALKTALLITHVLALLATLALAWRTWRGGARSWSRLPRPGPADAVLLVVTMGWVVLGPMQVDDGWYLLMARGAGESGYVGNYVNIFNVTEAPFATSQYLMYLWGSIGGWSLLWLRLLPVLYGIATWAMLRVLLHVALGRAAGFRRVQWALLVAHLVWWLPYGLTLRPEPFLTMCAAAVLLLTELARRRQSLGLLVLATAAAVLAVVTTPSGIVAAAPLVPALPWLGRWLLAAGWFERATVVALTGATLTVAVPIGFADTSLGQAADANAVRRWYFFTFPWYEENVHWDLLLSEESWGRRVPVLLVVGVLLMVAVGSGRRRPQDPVRRLTMSAAITTAVGFVLLLPTPTKGVNHFGTLAAAGTVLLTTALLRSPVPQRLGRAGPSLPAVVAVLLVVGASALGFSGPNKWLPYSDWGQPFGDHVDDDMAELRPDIGTLYLGEPAVWLVGAAAVATALTWWRRHRRSTMTADRAVLLAACGGATLLMLIVFVVAPVRQAPGFSVAKGNLKALTGDSCGLARGVEVLAPSGRPLGTPVGDEIRGGGFGRTVQPPPLAAPAPGPVWHDAGSGVPETGELTTPWWPLPALGELLTVPVAAGEYQGQEVVVQFARDGVPVPVAEYRLPLQPMRSDTWQDVPVDVPPGSGAVRLVARDHRTGPGTWLAVAMPRLVEWVAVSRVIGDRPAFADQLSAPLWPCVNQIEIEHGIVETPQVYLDTDSGIADLVLRNPYFDYGGGNLANVERTTTYVQLASRLDPAPGVPIRPWGQIRIAIPDHPVGLVDFAVTDSRRNGWERGPTLADEAYSGRRDTG